MRVEVLTYKASVSPIFIKHLSDLKIVSPKSAKIIAEKVDIIQKFLIKILDSIDEKSVIPTLSVKVPIPNTKYAILYKIQLQRKNSHIKNS